MGMNDLFIDPFISFSRNIIVLIFLGTKYRSVLSVGDCFRLDQTSHSISGFHHSMLWMQQVLKQLNAGEHGTISQVQVLDDLSNVSFQLGDLYRAVDFTHRLLSLGRILGS